VIRNGKVEVAEPINLPEGSEVVIASTAHALFPNCSAEDRPMTPAETAETLAAMDRVEPFDMSDDERASADAWEKQVNEYTIANLDRGVEDAFP
jgi:hypothetical protein